MKDFLRQNGILLLVIALLLSILIGVLSVVMGGQADPLSNLTNTIVSPLRGGVTAAADWVEGVYTYIFHYGELEQELNGLRVRVGELEIARAGLTENEAKKAGLRVKSVTASGCDRPGICPNPQEITIKLIYETNTRQVVGAQAWGGKNVSTRVNAIAVAIRAGMTADALSQVDFVYSSCTSSIWDPIQVVCGQAR